MELHENALSAQAVLSAAYSHSYSASLLSDDAWKMALSSEQITTFGVRQMSDPLWQLSGLYARTKLVNQVILARQSLVLSTIQGSIQYEQVLHALDGYLVQQLEELIPAINRAEQNLVCEDFRTEFAKNTLMAEYAKIERQRPP